MQSGVNELLTIDAWGQLQLKGKLDDNSGGPTTPRQLHSSKRNGPQLYFCSRAEYPWK